MRSKTAHPENPSFTGSRNPPFAPAWLLPQRLGRRGWQPIGHPHRRGSDECRPVSDIDGGSSRAAASAAPRRIAIGLPVVRRNVAGIDLGSRLGPTGGSCRCEPGGVRSGYFCAAHGNVIPRFASREHDVRLDHRSSATASRAPTGSACPSAHRPREARCCPACGHSPREYTTGCSHRTPRAATLGWRAASSSLSCGKPPRSYRSTCF